MRDVVVAGAGMAGLAVAHALGRRGLEPLVLEAQERPGGKVRSARAEGFLCEDGPFAMMDRGGVVTALTEELGLGHHVVSRSETAARRYLWVDRALVEGPRSLVGLARSRLLPIGAKLRMLGDLVLKRGPAGLGEDESVAAFFRRRFGRAVVERLAAAVTSGIWAGDPEQLSLPAVLPELAGLERRHRSVLVGALRARGRSAGATPGSFRGGLEELTARLAGRAGDRLVLGVPVRRIEKQGASFRLSLVRKGRATELRTRALVLALPAHAAVPLVGPIDAWAATALDGIAYAPVAVVHLGYRRSEVPHPLDAIGFLASPSDRVDLLGAVFASSAFPGRAPDGMVLLSAMVGGALRQSATTSGDEALVSQVRVGLRRTLGIEASPAFVRVARHPQAIPQYTLGHERRVAALDAAEERSPGLFFAGSAARGVGLYHCIRGAGPIADRIIERLERLGVSYEPMAA